MPTNLSRRELLAWMAAATGGAAAGGSLLFDGTRDAAPGATPPRAAPPAGTTAPAVDTPAAPPVTERADPPRQIDGDRMLVVVEFPGGNDGLSTVVPYTDGAYYDAREQTAIAEADVLDLDGRVGLHPNLASLHARGVTVVQGVGSFEPSGSHFEMQQRWWAGLGAPASQHPTGWVGRLGDVLAPEPGVMRAVSIADGSHPIARSQRNSTMTIPGLDAIQLLSGDAEGDVMRQAYQEALRGFAGVGATSSVGSAHDRQRQLLGSTVEFADRLVGADRSGDPEADGYTWDLFQQRLWLAATMLAGDVGIRVVHLELDGDFDTHDGHGWRHPELMSRLDAGLDAFRSDLERRGIADRVMVMTTSEFGRTIEENGNAGLDHGTASAALVVGPTEPAVLGDLPSLTRLDDNGDQVASMPVESYLGGVVESWLGVPATELFGAGVDPIAMG